MVVRYPSREPFIANTECAWFDFLAAKAVDGRVDEVNFWLPKPRGPAGACEVVSSSALGR